MPTRTELAFVFALVACAPALAADVIAPAHPLDDSAAVKAAFAARIGHPVHVLTFGFGEHYADAVVQNDAAHDEFDRFEMSPGQPMKESPTGQPLSVPIGRFTCGGSSVHAVDQLFGSILAIAGSQF